MELRRPWKIGTLTNWHLIIVVVLAGGTTYATCASDTNTSRIAQVAQLSGWQAAKSSVFRSIEYIRRVDILSSQNASGKLWIVWRSMLVFAACGFLSIAFLLGKRLQGGSDLKESLRRALNLSNSDAASIMASESVNDASEVDPGILKKHSTFESYETPLFTYPSIRTFFHPHPQAEKLPSKPTPLPLLVFVHGLGGSLAQFHLLLTSVINVGPCLGIDLPGCGRSKFSPTDWSAYSIEAMTLLLEAVIEKHLKRDEGQGFVLISHSMGCSISALLTSKTSSHPSAIRQNALGLVGICPRAEPPSQKEVKGYQKLLWIPNPIFNLYRMWDRRGGLHSTSVTRFVGKDGDEDTKRLQERYNGQSRTPVWRRMAWGTLPTFDNEGSPHGGFPGLPVWKGLELPVFLIAGESDHVTKPEELQKIANALVMSMQELNGDQALPSHKEISSSRPTTPKIFDPSSLDKPPTPKTSDLPFLNNGSIKPFSEIEEFQVNLAAHERNKATIGGQILELDSSTEARVNGNKDDGKGPEDLKNTFVAEPQITVADPPTQSNPEEDGSTDETSTELTGLRNEVDQPVERSSEDDLEAAEATETAVYTANTHPAIEPGSDSFPEFSKPRRSLKTTILPPPASHAMLFDYATYRTLAGLIETFLAEKVDHRLSLGWQLQHLSTSGKWDVKNLAKWQKATPVSLPIGGVFRAMKTLRGIDEVHTPKKFVEQWKGKIYAVIDISHDSPVYNPAELQQGGIEYHKFSTVSKIPPTKDEVKDFISLVERVRAKAPTVEEGKDAPVIGAHCHYGFNRTGFYLISYLIEKRGYTVNNAIEEFAEQRPPGIKHAHFINELSVRYTKGLKRSPTQ